MVAEEPERRRPGGDWGPWVDPSAWGSWLTPPGQRLPTPTQPLALMQPALEKVKAALEKRLLNREHAFATSRGEVRFTVTEVDLPLDGTALRTGIWEDITVQARDVSWQGLRAPAAQLVLRNPHLRGRDPIQLVAAPAEGRVTLDQETVDALVQRVRPDLRVVLTEDARVLVKFSERPSWGHLEVDAGGRGTHLWVKPRRLVRGSRSTGAVRRIPTIHLPLPLPAGRTQLLAVEPGASALDLVLTLDQARIPLDAPGWGEVVRLLDGVAAMWDPTRWSR